MSARAINWGILSLAAGAIPLILLIVSVNAGLLFLNLPDLVMIGAMILFPLSAAMAWQAGDRRLIAGGCAMWLVPASASFFALVLAISFAAR